MRMKNIITFNVHRDTGKVKVKDLFFSVGDFVNKGDLILTYEYEEYFGLKKEIRKYYSAKQGRIKSSDLSRGSEISKGRHLFHLDPETTKSDNQKNLKMDVLLIHTIIYFNFYQKQEFLVR